ncbi:hypothetical protein Psal073_01020 [Piscirickettsia salmonis]|nr:hypothetical protein Psal073_01020 [Piscirickettsia salmonis]
MTEGGLIAEYSQPNYLPIFQARAMHAKHPKDILTILNIIYPHCSMLVLTTR